MEIIEILYSFLGRTINILCLFYAVFVLLELLSRRRREKRSYKLKIYLCDAIFGVSLVLLFIERKQQMPMDLSLFWLAVISLIGMKVNYDVYQFLKKEEQKPPQ